MEILGKIRRMHFRDKLSLHEITTGQRPADVLKLARSDIRNGALHIEQNKTGKKIRMTIEGDLAVLIQRMSTRKVMSLQLVNNKDGHPMTKATHQRGIGALQVSSKRCEYHRVTLPACY